MTLRDYIQELEGIRNVHGDLTVLAYDSGNGRWSIPEALVQEWSWFSDVMNEDDLPCGVEPPNGPFVALS